MTHPLIEKYGDPLPLVTAEPQSATDLYRLWANSPEWKSLNRRRRNERRWLGMHLQHLANEGVIQHGTVTTEHGGEWRGFWSVDPDETGHHQPRGAGRQHQDGRQAGRGVVQ